jgi:hypothetical protein
MNTLLIINVVWSAFAVGFFSANLLILYRKPKNKPLAVGEERQKEIDKMDKHFKGLMNYDVGTATRKKVNS